MLLSYFDSENGGDIPLKCQLTTQCFIQEDRTVYKHCGENLRAYIYGIKCFTKSIYFNSWPPPGPGSLVGGGGGVNSWTEFNMAIPTKKVTYFILILKSSDQDMSSQMSVSVVVDYNYRQYLPGI
jgi:hypothetical protein